MRKTVAFAIVSLVMLVGCSKGAPDCNDVKTRQKVLEKVGIPAIAIPAFLATREREPNITVDDFLKNNIKTEYSDNRVSVSVKGPKETMHIAFVMNDIKVINFDKATGKYECACNITREMGGAKEGQPISVNYTSELSGGNKKHYVSVTVLDPFHPATKHILPDLDLKTLLEKAKAQVTN